MTLQKLLQGIQALTLRSIPENTLSQPAVVRLFHGSSVCCRVLNRRLYPINKCPSDKGKWEVRKPMRELYKYTTRPLPLHKTGGRGPNGHIWNWRQGGGHKHLYRMLDLNRCPIDMKKPMVEKVEAILYDPNRSSRIALVAGGERKRYIIATVNMKPGDLIKSSRELLDSPIRAAEGDSYPVGSLAMGTIINSLEMYPGEGSTTAMAAGAQAQIIRKAGEQIIIRLPSKYEVSLQPNCIATVGRVGNITHNQMNLGKAGRNRWKGIRPKSGFFQKKTGRFGRKIRKQKSAQIFTEPRNRRELMTRVPIRLLPKNKILKKQFHY